MIKRKASKIDIKEDDIYTLKPTDAYKCKKCGKLYHSNGICMCVAIDKCTHKEVENVGGKLQTYKCLSCGSERIGLTGTESFIKERDQRLSNSHGDEILFELKGDSWQLVK